MKAFLTILSLAVTISASSRLKISNLNDIRDENRHLVTEIDLSNQGLTVFPKEILNCYNLKKLDVSNNGLFHVPLELAQLSALEELNFSRNQGISMIDLDTIFAVASFELEKLNLSDCEAFMLPENLSNQLKLQELDISSNRIVDIPSSCMRLSQMKRVDFSDNRLRDFSWVLSYWWELKEIDLKNNPSLDTDRMIMVLSLFDYLDRLEVSHIGELPSQFQYMNVGKLVIHDSEILKFPRTDFSSPIRHLELKNCHIKNVPRFTEIVNASVKPNYLVLDQMSKEQLIQMKSLELDSLALVDIQDVDLTHLIPSEDLKWVDIRLSDPIAGSMAHFSSKRPEVEILSSEPISSNKGVNPPIAKFAPRPEQRTIDGGRSQQLTMGNSRFTIPEETFLTTNGTVYEGPVTLEYTEYMSPMDIMLSGINMTAKSGGENRMLSSGGMFTLLAKDDQGRDLSMNSEKAIDVQMTSSSNDPDMIVWELDEDGQWEAAGEDSIVEPFQVDQSKIDAILEKDFAELLRVQTTYFEHRYVPKLKWIRRDQTFEITFEKYRTNFEGLHIDKKQKKVEVLNPDLSSDFLAQYSLIYNGDEAKELFQKYRKITKDSKKIYSRLRTKSRSFGQQLLNVALYSPIGPNYFKRIRLLPDFEHDCYSLSFIYKNEKMSFPVHLASSKSDAGRSIKENERFYKEYSQRLKKAYRIRKKNKATIDRFFNLQGEKVRRAEVKKELAVQKAIWDERQFMNANAGSASTSRIFEIRSFGTFNCDVLSRMTLPKKVSPNFVNVETGQSIEETEPKVIYVDEDKNGVLTYEKGEDVVIDEAAKSTLIVFISATVVGVYKHFRDKLLRADRTELKVMDLSTMSNREFMNVLTQ